ncbi:MAG TPA: aminotransferase class V-fold PLP-dependent enzyme [Solirubrobacteraceae bacterium]|nr:aminotransferase class V-fold PLP-dependent enzyme [Solirubrobacteraceae bacterium]
MPPLADLWDPAGPYLNTASYGLPPRTGWDALQAALADWRGGRTSWEQWGESGERARASFARLNGFATADVANGSNVSQFVGIVAAALPDGSTVLAPEAEFTSLLFPFLAHADRGVRTRTAPLEQLAEAVDADTTLVAFSPVQSADGAVADSEAIIAAARDHGALVLLDVTQACGWLPIDHLGADFVTAAAYKWLMSPRGSAFLAVAPECLDRLPPLGANWYAGEDFRTSYYGPPLRLAADARRLDLSPAWFSWVGSAPALEAIEAVGVDRVHAHNVALANRFRAGLGLEPSNSAIVSADVPGAQERLERAGIRAAVRAGALRASFHLYNDEADVDAALDALAA